MNCYFFEQYRVIYYVKEKQTIYRQGIYRRMEASSLNKIWNASCIV